MACSASTSDQIINTRRAFGVWYLFYYALYLAVLGLAYLPKQEELKTKFKRFHHDVLACTPTPLLGGWGVHVENVCTQPPPELKMLLKYFTQNIFLHN